MPELMLLQDTFWFLSATGWLLAAALGWRLLDGTAAPPTARRGAWLGAMLAAIAALVHLFTHHRGVAEELVQADLVAGTLVAASLLVFTVTRAWRWSGTSPARATVFLAAYGGSILAWPSIWIHLGWLPGLLRTDFLPWGFARSLVHTAFAVAGVAAVWHAAPRPRQRRHLVPCWFAAVAVAGALLAEATAHFTHRRLEETALARVKSLALALDVEAVATLPLDASTLQSAPFRTLRAQLLRLRRANPDVAYLYLAMIHEGNLVYPVSGAEYYEATPGGEKLAEPDEPFEVGGPAGDELRASFAARAPYLAGLSRDPYYGTLITAFAPVPAATGREPRMFLGMDFRPTTYHSAVRQTRWLAYALTLIGFGAALLFLRYQINAEAAAAARDAAAAAAERERTRNEFLGQVSHELQTPLHGILAQAQDLARDPSAQVRDGSTQILEQAGQLQRLIEDLLQASALQSPSFRLHPNPCDLAALLRELAAAHESRAKEKGLTVELNLDAQLPPRLLADRMRVRQVVGNLLHNAIKYTPSGRVTVTARRCDGAAPAVEIAVADTGPGLAEDLRDRLFQPFARGQSTAAQPGAGLGLSVARALCRRMEGELSVRAVQPHGAEFLVRLPLIVAPVAAAAESKATTSTDGDSVLLVEDHPLLREHLTDLLVKLGWQVHAVDTLESARTAARNQPPRAALVDLHLGEVSTLPLIAELARQQPRPWIAAISASRDPRDSEHAVAAGADDFLFKPISPEALREALSLVAAPRSGPDEAAFARALDAGDLPAAKAAAHYQLNTALARQSDRVALWREIEARLTADDPVGARQRFEAQRGVADDGTRGSLAT